MSKKKYITSIVIYLSILYFIAIFHLYFKHSGGADSTISEWLINYQGGFTKRGIIGEFCFQVAKFFNLKLRYVIYLSQITIIGIYYLLIYNFIKKISFNYFLILIIFSPIFLLYPLAELEVLGRKEIFIFIGFIIFLTFNSNKVEDKKDIYYVVFILPILVLIWEPVIFYTPFFLTALIIKYEFNNLYKIFKSITLFLPAILISFYIALNPINEENHLILSNSLKENFGEECYMSCALLLSKSSIKSQFTTNFPLYSPVIFIRYFLVVLIGFGPLFLLSKNSKFVSKTTFSNFFSNFLILLIILILPMIILFAMGSDWGRWVNITYTFACLFFIHLYKNNFIKINFNFFEKYKVFKDKNILILFFIVFCFGWNPKTSLTGDIGSLPGYRVPYNFIKTVINNF